ncbi:helix-turn-helix domain-containing protein [Paenibacillus sp. FSL R7-0204]|uniref:AraC family transcriptional regulator n=1 Tax=Paenibacillus sp. FSL R7-0204 TaxID=2921675 RepID=UPI0030F591AA
MHNNVILHFDKVLNVQDLGSHRTESLYTHPDRRLEWEVFLYLADGQMEVWEEETEYLIRKGEFLFLKSGLHHWGEPRTPAGTSWYWIHFFCNSEGEAEQNSNPLKGKPLLEEFRKCITLPKHGRISHPEKLEKQLKAAVQLYNTTDPLRTITLSLQTMELFITLFRQSLHQSPLSKSDRTVSRIIEFLEQKDSYTLNSQELSASLEMNYSYLCEVFKHKTGSTIQMYNAQFFMDKAAGMMRNTNLNVSEISERLGFNSPFYFSRVFRKVKGCSPSEYMSRIY